MVRFTHENCLSVSTQHIVFSGQRLHETPYQQLENFGIFNGNRIILVGEKVS